jgi:hypothetical protein
MSSTSLNTPVYFAGGYYPPKQPCDDPQKVFAAVCPSNELPYVYDNDFVALRAYSLMSHHSSLYVTVDFISAHPMLLKEKPPVNGEMIPGSLILPKDVSLRLQQAWAKNSKK